MADNFARKGASVATQLVKTKIAKFLQVCYSAFTLVITSKNVSHFWTHKIHFVVHSINYNNLTALSRSKSDLFPTIIMGNSLLSFTLNI